MNTATAPAEHTPVIDRSSLRVMTPIQAAEYLTLSISTLARMRISGNGPTFIRLSPQKIGYRQTDLDKFLEARVRTSTSQS